MAKQNDPTAGKWAFAPGGKDKAARALASEDRKPYGRRTPKEIESLERRSDAARKGRN